MYQYRNLPPRHQPPGFYPPHQPSLRQQQNPHQHSLHPVDDQHYTRINTPLIRSHSHGIIQNHHRYQQHHHHKNNNNNNNNNHSNQNGYRTHHIISSPPPKPTQTNTPDALQHYALQQVQRIKAVTACQIIESRVVEAMKQQQMKKLQEKLLKRKLYPNWKDPNETNPNNPAYKGPPSGKMHMINYKSPKKSKKNTPEQDYDTLYEQDEDTDHDLDLDQDSITDTDVQTYDANEDVELTENDKMMTIPQLEISTAPKSTANITNLTDEELKMNPELYTMYRYYIPFANSHNSPSNSNHLRSQSLPPTPPDNHHDIDSHSHHSHQHHSHQHRTNMGPRRRNPNFLKPQLLSNGMIISSQSGSESSSTSNMRTHSFSPSKPMNPKAKLIPIGKVKPNPLERNPSPRKHSYEPHIAPAHANVQSVISPNGGIYHPCHGYSTRDISIFDLFPGIVKYQSKKYAECDRVDYLLTLSEKSFCSVNNRPLKVDESEMWYTALKYLFNDITLGQFDYMSVEMRYVIKQYMSTHKNRLSFLNSIKNYGFLRVISDISKKLPIDRIQKIILQEKQQKEKEKLLLLCNHRIKEQNRKKLLFQQQQFIIQQQQQQQQFIQQQQQQQIYHHHHHHTQNHYSDWYNGNKLKRTISEPTHMNINHKPPTIIDDEGEQGEQEQEEEEEEEDDIDDPWKLITQIVNNNKIPDLPPENTPKNKKNSCQNMDEIVDVYTMLYQTMKDENKNQNDNGPNISFADLTIIDQSPKNIQNDSFIPKVN